MALITTTQVKDLYLDIEGTTYDAQLAEMITAATSRINAICGHPGSCTIHLRSVCTRCEQQGCYRKLRSWRNGYD